MTENERRTEILNQHSAECDECSRQPVIVPELGELLAHSTVSVDPAQLSERAMFWLRPELESNAADALWRRVLTGLTLAIAPLPLVLAWDAYLLRAIHEILGSLVPVTVASYVVFSYGMLLALLLAATYAAIPIAMGRPRFRAPNSLPGFRES